MIYTEDNYGMDGKVSLPSLPANTNWQGLEDLYRVNESIYEDRQNYRLSLADWTNYLKDVDRVFALLNSHHERKKANKTQAAQSDGAPVGSAELPVPVEMSDADPSHTAGEAPHLTLPADLRTLHLDQPTLNPEGKLEWNNDIPEASPLNSEHWSNHQTENWVEHEDISHLETGASGNGLTELTLLPRPRLQPLSGYKKDPPQEGGPEDDVFEDQLHLPVHSDRTLVHQTVNAATMEQPMNSSLVERMLTTVEKNSTMDSSPHLEGSASSPLFSD